METPDPGGECAGSLAERKRDDNERGNLHALNHEQTLPHERRLKRDFPDIYRKRGMIKLADEHVTI